MSFLPYAPDPPAAWVAAVSGSTVVHGGMLAALLMSSVALLPEPSTSALRSPEFEITLEIVDAEIISLSESEIAPDVGTLSPVDGDTAMPEQVQEDGLAPVDDATLLAPDDDVMGPVSDVLAPAEEDFALLAPEPEVVPALPELVEDAPVLAPEDTSEPAPVAPTEAQEPDDLAIDDLSPIEDTAISPLAESVAPAPLPPAAPIAPATETPVVEAPRAQTPGQDIETLPATPAPEATLAPDVDADIGEAVETVVLPEPPSSESDVITLDTTEENISPAALPPLDDTVPAPDVRDEDIAPPAVVEDVTSPLITEEPEAPTAVDTGDAPVEPELVLEPDVVDQVAPVDDLAALIPDVADDLDTQSTPSDDTVVDPTVPQIIDNPSPSAQLIGTLLQRIRDIPAPQCTLALPRRVGPEDVAVSFVGTESQMLDTLAARVLDGVVPAPAQTREMLDARQCAVLDAVRLSASYPASRIGLSLEDTTLSSGDSLRARVTGAGGLYLSLLLVDDNGVVQDLARFAAVEGSVAVIDAPVARAGDTRTTRQVLLVLGSSDAPIDLSQNIGRTAQDVLSDIPRSTLEQVLFGLITFDVQ